MQLGLDTYSFHLAFGKHLDRKADGPMTLAKCIRRAKELGFVAVQIDPAHFNLEKDNPKWVRSMADRLDVALEAGAVGTESERLRQGLEVASAWKSPVLRTFLGWEYPRSRRHSEDKLRKAADSLAEVIEDAKRAGVVIALENHSDISTPDLITLLEMVDSPYLGACLDTGNSMVFLEDPVWTAEQLAPWAVTAHVKDQRWQVTASGAKLVGAPLGDGHIDLDRVIPVLLDAPRLDRIMLQCSTEAAGTGTQILKAEDQAVERSIEFWNRWIDSHS